MRSIIQHLRFPFSFLLLPVFLFALLHLPKEDILSWNGLILFIILHLVVYPSSNGYNSLEDKDVGSVGLIEKPLAVDKRLGLITKMMDLLALNLAFLLSWECVFYILMYITASRLYSWRKVRIKKYPYLSFLGVFIMQGGWVYYLTQNSLSPEPFTQWHLALAASCLIGAIYPLSQIYQHKQDLEDGVHTLSASLGKRGSFLFSAFLFMLGTTLILQHLNFKHLDLEYYFFILCLLPSMLFFTYWFLQVVKDEKKATYKNSMRMNVIAALGMNVFFIGALLLKLFG